jgi:PKD repeat protein
MNRTLLATAIFALLGTSTLAQAPSPLPCHADDLSKLVSLHGNDPVELARMAQAEAELEEFTREFEASGAQGARVDYVLPVVFHVIHNNGPENISDEQIFDAIRVLNDDFNKLNSDWPNVRPQFLDLVADVGIEFRLARKDPQGNCTNGITRTVSSLTYVGDQEMKELIQWPRNKYLNVWVAASANGAAGYTYRPGSVSTWPVADGIVLLHNYTGSIGTSSAYTSRTLTHEVGHWINLAHTWGNSNDAALASNCSSDDGVTDTPNTIGWTSCNLNGATCGSALDNVENYMDYSYCSKMFTLGQSTRMLAAMNSGTAQRNQLWQPSNLAATGVDGPGELCVANFISSSNSICSGSIVDFNDVSYHNVTSRTWSFPGGDPSTSSEEAPSVVYTTPGVYPVVLEVTDGTTTLSRSDTAYITVLSNPGASVPLEDGFESYTTIGDAPWTAVDADGDNGFSLTSAAAFTGTKSVRLANTSAMATRKDELVSTTYDMSAVGNIRISYRYAFAQRNSANDDRLRFYVSNNCGETWSLRQQLRGSTNLTTGGVVTGTFVPVTSAQWEFAEVSNVSDSYHTPDFRFKFEFESDGGNYLYIDDININGSPVGIEDVAQASSEPMVVPNPARGQAQLMFNLETSGMVELEMLDVLGRSITTLKAGQMAAGLHRLDLPVSSLQSGLYFIRMQQGASKKVVRFIVE